MGSKPSAPSCSNTGNNFCNNIDYSNGCMDISGSWKCKCKVGFQTKGSASGSTCVDINECSMATDDCRSKNSACTNTIGSYECGCGSFMEIDQGKCKDINECLQDKGGCAQFSDCFNQEAAAPICKCHEGYSGGGSPGVACRDINECSTQPPVCVSPSVCVNQPGTYTCECPPGYEPDKSGNSCKTEDFCETKQHDCDPQFANCSLVPGSYVCECKVGLTGTGKMGACVPLPGHEDIPCALQGNTCSSYSECARSSTSIGIYECRDLPAMQQLGTFFSEGSSSETPSWVWAIVALGSISLIIIAGIVLCILYKRFRKRNIDEEEEPLTNDGHLGAMMDGGYAEYGARGYA